jgi:large subunit ribosomal protein L25
MSSMALDATLRSAAGKGNCRRIRNGGNIPAIAYGKGLSSALSLTVSPKALRTILAGERGRNTVINLQLPGQEALPTLVADIQIHPVSREILHADFLKVDLDEPVDVRVKLEVTGRSEGITQGGKLSQVFRTLPVRCLPLQVPVQITCDVTPIGLDQSLAVKDLQLPEGVTVTLPPNQTLVGVYADKRKKEEEEAAAAEAAKA